MPETTRYTVSIFDGREHDPVIFNDTASAHGFLTAQGYGLYIALRPDLISYKGHGNYATVLQERVTR